MRLVSHHGPAASHAFAPLCCRTSLRGSYSTPPEEGRKRERRRFVRANARARAERDCARSLSGVVYLVIQYFSTSEEYYARYCVNQKASSLFELLLREIIIVTPRVSEFTWLSFLFELILSGSPQTLSFRNDDFILTYGIWNIVCFARRVSRSEAYLG